ncbi:hypothetical protein A3Q35_13210 [Aeribacillus pallidus]|uniref:phage neck terminator protein n=1 Tax=Aeribacillus pallidus TaxID=33936 RepID=UPI0007B4D566|nr:hypothetical protein [Aeribacillus pallidus]KZM54912.1 hypothetical protein A3Q35_13210 [Aeribacillus pallidus]
MSNDFDYTTVTSALIKAIKEGSGYPLIADNSVGDPPPYPYCSYTITSPKIDIERDYEGAIFELVVSLTWHGTSSVGVLNLAKKAESYLKSSQGRSFLEKQGIVVVSTMNFSQRDNFISIDYERTAGFDVQLRVRDTYVDDVESIEEFKIGGTN